MVTGFFLSLREGLEIALVIGIVLGSLKRLQRTDLAGAVWLGVLGAAALSFLAAVGLTLIGASLEGSAEAIFEGSLMLLAAAVLTWMIFWMRKHARLLKDEIQNGVRAASRLGTASLFVLAFVTVLREGLELALLLSAAMFSSQTGTTVVGSLLGLAVAAGLGFGFFAATIRLNLNRFFQITTIVLILFAAGLVAHGVHEFNEVGIIPSLIEHVWDTNAILPESSVLGQTLTTLLGYNGNPSLSEVLAYGLYLVGVLLAMKPLAIPTRKDKQALSY